MVNIKEAIILNKAAPKEEVSFSFDKGQVNRIPYKERYKFDFLGLANQSLDKGQFTIGETVIFPDEDNEKSIFFLAVNSLVKVGLYFLVEKANKKSTVKYVQDELVKLRELPTETNEDKNAKIAAIFTKIKEISPEYVLVNLNEKENKNNAFLDAQIEGISCDINVIVLEVKPEQPQLQQVIEEEQDINLIIGEAHEEIKEAPVEEANDFIVFETKKKNLFQNIWTSFKKNAMVFFSFLIPSIGVTTFLLLSPLYANTNNKVLIIPFVITIVICFALYILMTYKCTSFSMLKKGKEKNTKRAIFYTINSIITLLGIGVGVVIYLLFKNYDSDLKGQTNNTFGIICCIIISLLMLTSCLYITPLFNKIKKLFKKK